MEDDRIYGVQRLLADYVRSPSLRHIRDPLYLRKLAREIVKTVDRGNSIWTKWDGQREVLLRKALRCWVPTSDLRDALNLLPGPKLTNTDVEQRRLQMEEDENEFAFSITREIPIHGHIKKLVAQLKKDSKDGYLLSSLTFNKYGDRSNAIGKQFGRLKTELAYGPDYVFHSLRKGVATQLETAGIAENVTARLLGHDFQTMSYGLYSGGVSFDVLAKALGKVSWKK
jgi:hypothetical protein